MKLRFLAPLVIALPACLHSTGEDGVDGEVRFSQVEQFVETTDFSAPIVTNAGMLVQLEFPTSDLSDEEVMADVTLVVADANGTSASANAEVIPLGFAQYAVTLSKNGAFTLIANKAGNPLDSLPITAGSANGIKLHDTGDLITTVQSSNGKTCSTESQPDISSVVLTNGSSLVLHVVPVDGSGNAMLGMLELTATATGPVTLDGDYLGQGRAPNSFTVSPSGTLGGVAKITISDATSGKSTTFDLQTKDETPSGNCQ